MSGDGSNHDGSDRRSDCGTLEIDAIIFGGGAAGLWTLDALTRRGDAVLLLESESLGAGQTIASQGIIHGGLKYTLSGLLNSAARAIREMPARWRDSLGGRALPDLAGTRIRGETCYLWQTTDLRSRAGMLGAKAGLRVTPTTVAPDKRPAALASCPGQVAEMAEQVIDPASFITALASSHADRLLRINPNEVDFEITNDDTPAVVGSVRIQAADRALALRPRVVVFAAGTGNGDLRRAVGLNPAMQRRPLHMTVARGDLPWLHGHCVDGAHTRVTITSARDSADRTVWQIGGQIAEDGVDMEPEALIRHARAELQNVLPGVSLDGIEWTTYRVDRAEPATDGRRRPDDAYVRRDGNIITAWPTKLAMVPRLADLVCDAIEPSTASLSPDFTILSDWPRPIVAPPPWETTSTWTHDRSDTPAST